MAKKFTNSTPDIWGGLECSFNRVGDRYMDQLELTGHYDRGESDILHLATLRIKAIRYPVLWEKHQPELNKPIDWSWVTRRLENLRQNNIQPIAGLMHHGNGPAFTDLLSPSFPELFASYAGKVARQFPAIEWYTPINEPLTTARFSGLYGIWYPHKKKDKAFAAILFNQMKAVVLAMKAIREINPDAKLLQTEDLGKTYSTDLLRYQADFENERRWLTYDILCGNFTPDHPLWSFFEAQHVPDSMLYFFLDNPCPPDMIGADHYLTSERFLDQKLSQYPPYSYGGNHRHRYADVEAIRVKHSYPFGLEVLLKECWNRYGIPIAVSEVHLNGSTSDQIRWFRDVWDCIVRLKEEGLDIRSITSWALLGSVGWNTLLTTPNGHYESGAFLLKEGNLIPTELSSFIRDLSQNPNAFHPALAEPGWWKNDDRCLYNVGRRCRNLIPCDRAVVPVLDQ